MYCVRLNAIDFIIVDTVPCRPYSECALDLILFRQIGLTPPLNLVIFGACIHKQYCALTFECMGLCIDMVIYELNR